MAINPVAPLSVGDVAQAYSVPLEGLVDNLQQQQRLAIEQQRYAEQRALQQQQMDLQQQDAIDNALASVHASGTAYDEYVRQQQNDLFKQVAEYRKKNPRDIIGARSMARLGASDIDYRSQIAKRIADSAANQVSALQKANPFYKGNELTADILSRAFRDEKGNFRTMPDSNAVYALNELVQNPKYIDQPIFDRTVRESFSKTYQPQEAERRYNSGNIPMMQQYSSPFYNRLGDDGKFSIDAKPVQYGDVSVQVLSPNTSRQISNDPYLPVALPLIKRQLISLNPRYANLPDDLMNEVAKYEYVSKYGDSVKSSISNTRVDPAYEARYKQRQDAIDNQMAQERLGISREGLELQKQRLKSREEQLADANVFKDALSGVNRNNTTRKQQQQVFAKYQAPPPPTEMLNAFLGKYSRGKELAEAYKTPTKDGKRTFQAGNLSRDLTPINISGAYTNAKVINPFTGQRGSAQLWIDPTDQSKTALVFLTLKDIKDKDGYSHSVPDYDNMKVYEGDQASRFVDQIKDSEAKGGLQSTEFIEE